MLNFTQNLITSVSAMQEYTPLELFIEFLGTCYVFKNVFDIKGVQKNLRFILIRQ